MKFIKEIPKIGIALSLVLSFSFVLDVSHVHAQSTVDQNATSTSVQAAIDVIAQVSQPVVNIRDAVATTSKQVTDLFENSISQAIRSTGPSTSSNTSPEHLNSLIQFPQQNIIHTIQRTLNGTGTVTQASISALQTVILEDLANIGDILTKAVGAPSNAYVNSNIHSHDADITAALNALGKNVSTYNARLAASHGDLLSLDTDKDGLSDFDEMYVYHTDPHLPVSVTISGNTGKQLNDSEKVLQGIDPTSYTGALIQAEDIRASVVPANSAFALTGASLVAVSASTSASSTTATTSAIQFTGTALPNSVVTLYIFSTPIVVTVKSDANGDWKYVLNKELSDGQHQLYTAAVTNSGKIVARSNGFGFIKTAQAVSLDVESNQVGASAEDAQPSLTQNNNLWLILGAVVILLILALVIIGSSSSNGKPEQGV